MVKDVLIPSRLGQYYLFPKKVLSFDITPFAVHAILVIFTGNNVQVKNNKSILLKDFSIASIVAAIKKIATSIGSYDEVVTSLSSTTIVFKELQLPFIGREKLNMIVSYEVESLLPFALEQAVIDFMILEEDAKKGSSTILVAATLKENIDNQHSLFEKAGIPLHMLTVDMFALYSLYRHGVFTQKNGAKPVSGLLRKKFEKEIEQASIKSEQSKVELFVDFGFDVTRILYMQNGLLKTIRMIPYGVADIAQLISSDLELSSYEVIQEIIVKSEEDTYQTEVQQGLGKLFDEIKKTFAFFEKQVSGYTKPKKIIFSGLGCHINGFVDIAQTHFDITVEEVSVQQLFEKMNIKYSAQIAVDVEHVISLATALFTKYNQDINFLKNIASKFDNRLFYQQVFMIILLTVMCIGGIFWKSSTELQRWNQAYISSKKELLRTIEHTMNIDMKNEKNLKDIVQKTDTVLQKEHKLWFSFSKQTEQSYLEYLQDLSVHIDKESIGLDIKKLSLNPDKVTLVGVLKNFESLEVFKEELSELELLSVVEAPRELSFTIELKVKEKKG